MKFSRIASFVLAILLLAACGEKPGSQGSVLNDGVKPTPVAVTTKAPPVDQTMQGFLNDLKADNIAGMYAMTSQDSQQNISQDDFVKYYTDNLNQMSLKSLDYQILATTVNPNNAQSTFRITYHTSLVGDLQRDITANLKLENGQWKVVWDSGLILPELHGGNHLSMDYDVPDRGLIYDRNNDPIVTNTDAYAIGVVPGQINNKTEGLLLNELSRLTGFYPGVISGMYADAGPDWYVPIGEVTSDQMRGYYNLLTGLGGVVLNKYTTRYYLDDGIAPQAVGYTSALQPDEVNDYLRQGYSIAARIGRIGVEKWGEKYLDGKTGGTLYVVSSDGSIVSYIGKSDAQQADSIYLTIDTSLQTQAQQALVGFRGAIVVIERNTGRVLAMVSSPGFDPNLFDPNNYNSSSGLTNLLNDQSHPLLNRATQGQFPLGSVFKVITFSAALESGTYTPDTSYDCGYHFTELPDRVLNDWTWDYYQNELAAGDPPPYTQPSGKLTLVQGLMRSCDPYFWHIGKDLFDQGRVTAVSDMARGFGLGQATGIDEVEEVSGNIPNPANDLDAVNEAIGQGTVQVTPLQVARFMAAVGNGGTLYRPQIVEKIVDPAGNEVQTFKPDAQGVLPIKSSTLDALRQGLYAVVHDPRGTAYFRFLNIKIPIYGKTGTAESGSGLPHSWFAGYTDANNPDKPDIAIAVLAENAGEGSDYAAPIFKRVVEIYFDGHPVSPYWWESNIGITRTPTSPVTPTPNKKK